MTQSSNQLRPPTAGLNGKIMNNVSSEQQLRITNASYVVCYLALKGFTVYSTMYDYSVKVDILTETYSEALQAIEAMKGLTNLYKSRDITPRKDDAGKRFYWITYKF